MIYLPFMVNVVEYATPMDPMGMESSGPSLPVIPAQVFGSLGKGNHMSPNVPPQKVYIAHFITRVSPGKCYRRVG